jgi:PAS domain S-box-containing protein
MEDIMIGFTTASQIGKPRPHTATLRPYLIVVFATALVAAVLVSLREMGHPVPDVSPLLLPVLLGAFLSGFAGGLFAVALGLAVDGLLFRDLAFSQPFLAGFGLHSPAVSFLVGGVVLCFIGHWFRQSGQKAQDAMEKQQALEQEIGRRRKLEEALLRSQHTVKAQMAEIEGVYATVPIGLAMVDRELRFTRVNRRWSEISGLAPEAHIGRSLQTVVPDLGETLALSVKKVLLSGEPILEQEVRSMPPTDPAAERVWLASFVLLEETDERSIGVNIIIRDITEQKRFETALRESEEKYRLLTEWSPHCICMIDAAGTPIYANRHWFEFTGLSLEDARGQGWLSIVHPDDRERVTEQYLTALQDGARLETELRLRSKRNGEYRWHIMGALPLRGRLGALSNWLVVAMDVHQVKTTEQALRETEARLLLALEAGRMAVWEKSGIDGQLAWLDPKMLCSVMDFEGPMRSWIETIYSGLEPSGLIQPVETYSTEFRATGGDGQGRWLEAHARRLVDGNGDRLLGVLADVTERRRAEEALREADRKKDEFLGVLAHELRNPLAPILTSAQLLRRRGLERPDLLDSATGSIERQVKHLSRLIGDLADISRTARGKIELKPEILELNSAALQAAEGCRPLMDKHGQELLMNLPATPLYVKGDPARLAQVLENLLINASKFTPAEGRIHLAVTADGRHALISVRDEGIGIDPNALDKIFEPFVQLERPLHSGHTGLGIGLALAKRLVEMQGGQISARSAGKGQGSEFVIRLPLPEAGVPASRS